MTLIASFGHSFSQYSSQSDTHLFSSTLISLINSGKAWFLTTVEADSPSIFILSALRGQITVHSPQRLHKELTKSIDGFLTR